MDWKDDMPICSVYIVTYNQEKYIEKAVLSVLEQETSYKYEVLVGDDASTDNTASILRELEKRFRDRITVVYNKVNSYKSDNNLFIRLRSMCRGKYIICLEGDDFWLDTSKLHTQIKFLEEHPDYLAVAHNCKIVDVNSDALEISYPECKQNHYSFGHWIMGVLPGQTTTLLMVNPKYKKEVDWSLMNSLIVPGDRLIYFTLLSYGPVFCIQKAMSAYRYGQPQGSSYTSSVKYDYHSWKAFYSEVVNYSYKIEKKESIKYAEFAYLLNIFRGCKKHILTIKDLFTNPYTSTGRIKLLFMVICFVIKRDAFVIERNAIQTNEK